MQLTGSLRSKSIACNVRETDCNYYYVRCYNKIEDDNLLWMYTSDLVKFWIELYTILLILGEIWSKGSNLTSLLFVNVFAEVAQVNAKSLNINSYQLREKHCRGSPRQNVFSYSYLGILFTAAKNAEIRGLIANIFIPLWW